MAIFTRIALFSAALLLDAGGQGYAQTPQRTTATYDDWLVTCTTSAESQGQKSCEMVQAQTVQQNLVGQITLSRPVKDKPYRIFFQIPTNVWLPSGIKFVSETSLPATFKWCGPGRCLADADLGEPAVRNLRSRTEPGRVEYKDSEQHDVSLPVSFKGFGPALDWMERP
jgi:invasion protein IalB